MRILQILLDGALSATALCGAYLIRFDGRLTSTYCHQLSLLAIVFVSFHLIANGLFGVYRRLWRYTGLTEIAELFLATLSVTMVILSARAFERISIGGSQLSYGVIFVEFGLSFMLLASLRVARRLQTEHRQRRHWKQPLRKRTILVGAGDAGQMVARELSQRMDLGVDLIGFVDDDPRKLKKRIGNVTVYGATKDLARLVDSLFIDQVIITMPSAPSSEVRRIVDICREAEVETRILPGLFELLNGKVSINQLREVSLSDLLGREPVELDNASIAGYIEGRRVLVTGAGGSIGSELCRQLMQFEPQELLLLGKGENSIFSIYQELQAHREPVKLTPVIADVRDLDRLTNIFEKHLPQVVFHAAAHKHVPLMEENVSEAITNNIAGTQNLAELADQYRVETFVLVSSDKAVNPSSVMGATKRLAELIIQGLARGSRTKYVAVRFGNVLDSRGSVLPTWRKQIAQGGPVTITDRDASRYFMLIPEAVELIIQAGALGGDGEVFVLDMGNPVKILDLAHDLIKLSGLRPDHDIKIEYIGLRAGEKLHEELLTAEEGLTKTIYSKILVGKPQPFNNDALRRDLKSLYALAKLDQESSIRKNLSSIVGGTLHQQNTASG